MAEASGFPREEPMIVTRSVAITAYMSKHGKLAVQKNPAMGLLSYCVR
jgi:hypothetical protein